MLLILIKCQEYNKNQKRVGYKMKNEKLFLFGVAFLFIGVSTLGCDELQVNNALEKEQLKTSLTKKIPTSAGNAVTKEQAIYVATLFANKFDFSYHKLAAQNEVNKGVIKKRIKNTLAINGVLYAQAGVICFSI